MQCFTSSSSPIKIPIKMLEKIHNDTHKCQHLSRISYLTVLIIRRDQIKEH